VVGGCKKGPIKKGRGGEGGENQMGKQTDAERPGGRGGGKREPVPRALGCQKGHPIGMV